MGAPDPSVPLGGDVPANDPAPRVAVADSRGIRGIRHLERFLRVDEVIPVAEAQRRGQSPDVALVWGRKETGRRTLDFARERELPIWYLEDGWIRSSSADAHSRTTYSMLVDEQGVYYDARGPSALESFLVDDEQVSLECDAMVIDRARRWRESLVDAGVTKYNWYRAASKPVPTDPFVLVVDQTLDDASVACGGMDERAFLSMLEAAVDENPGRDVVVRTHPDVVAGRRSGYLSTAARHYKLELVAGNDDPYRWLVAADSVYVGTSQLGYEALLAERPVSVFGMPFYAGWGLTDDRATDHPALARRAAGRGAARTVDELFHAAHVRLARYRSPVDGSEWSLGDCLDHVALQRREFARNATRMHGVGITPWKRRYVERFLRSPDGRLSFGARLPADGADAIVTWSFRHSADGARERTRAAREPGDGADPGQGTSEGGRGRPSRRVSGLPVWRLEDGFLRSVGLGSDFTAPGSLVLDTSGLYFDSGSPSDLEKLLNEHDCRPGEIQRASRLRRRILDSGVSKYTLEGERQGAHGFERPPGRRSVLVVGQVEDDESVKRGCAAVSTNTELLQAARKARPDDWIVYRPHPDVASGNRQGEIDPVACAGCADAVDAGGSIGACIDAVDEVHVMTSLTGFEALMRGRDVVTWGAPFYAGWGLTDDRMSVPRRTRRRTLDELVYLALIEYPRYIDIDSGEFVTAETMVSIIEAERARAASHPPGRWGARPLLKLSNIVKGLSYAP